MADDFADKTQRPTPHRRQQARQAGRAAHSAELTSAGVLLGGLLALAVAGGGLVQFLTALVTSQLGGGSWIGTLQTHALDESLAAQWNALALGLAQALLPVLGLVTLLAVGISLLQTGPMFLPSRIVPDFSRINPLAGMGRTVSEAGAVRLAMGLVKIAVIGGVAAASLYDQRGRLLGAGGLELGQLAALAWEFCLWTSVRIGLALGALALVDYGYQWWRFERELQMTPQELRDELRAVQGDPGIASRRRASREQWMTRSLTAAVPGADVVVVSRSLAVALSYDTAAGGGPVVVARGAGSIAAQIRKLAESVGVAVVEEARLADALYRDSAHGEAVSAEHYRTLAEILARVKA